MSGIELIVKVAKQTNCSILAFAILSSPQVMNPIGCVCIVCVCALESASTKLLKWQRNRTILKKYWDPFTKELQKPRSSSPRLAKKNYIWFRFSSFSLYCVFVWVCVLELILLAFFLIECYFWRSLYDSLVFWCSYTGIQEWYSNLDSWTF